MVEQSLLERYKNKLKAARLIVKYLKSWWWIVASILALITAFFCINPFRWNADLAYILYCAFAFILGSFIVVGIYLVLKNKYGGKFNFNEQKRGFLIDILKEEGFYQKEKIDYLIKIIDGFIDSLKISKELFKPIAAFLVTFFIPLSVWWFTLPENLPVIKKELPSILIVCTQLFGLVYLLIPIVESIVNRDYYIYKDFQSMLKDIYLTDFCGSKSNDPE